MNVLTDGGSENKEAFNFIDVKIANICAFLLQIQINVALILCILQLH